MMDRPYMICSDSSKFAIGAVLCKQWEGKWCAVAYVSRLLRGPELNYSVQEWEALAIIYALKKFNHYICATQIKVRSMDQKKNKISNIKFFFSVYPCITGKANDI